jgi:phytoene dehydrogenase-like protein
MAELFARLDVPVAKSDMTFSASLKGGALEYGLRNLRAVFAQKRNALNPKFLGMIRDIVKFNARALDAARDRTQPLGAFLEELGTGDWFRDYYLLPLSGAIWSTPTEKVLDFPAHALIRFFENHALLHHTGQHQWYTVQGGSVEYVRRLGAEMRRQGVAMRLGCPVEAVRRTPSGVEIRAAGDWAAYDDVGLCQPFRRHAAASVRRDRRRDPRAGRDPLPAEPGGAARRHLADAETPGLLVVLELYRDRAEGDERDRPDLLDELPAAHPGGRSAFCHAEPVCADPRALHP